MKQKQVDPETILYLSFDHPMFDDVPLNQILDIYKTRVLRGRAPTLYLLDELHYLKNWDRWIKVLVDQPSARDRPPDIVATGSASLVLKRARESGAGRWTTIFVPTLSLLEFAEMQGVSCRLPAVKSLAEIAALSRDDLAAAAAASSVVEPLWSEYMIRGGLPEGTRTPWPRMSALIREDMVDRVLSRDIQQIGTVDDPAALRKLFLYLCVDPGRMVSADALSQVSGISRPTGRKYLDYLAQANLVRRIDPFSIDGKKIFKLPPKYYPSDIGVRNALIGRGEELLRDATESGQAVEAIVSSHLWTWYRSQHTYRTGYWRAAPATKEIDFVAEAPDGGTELIEVKYRENTALSPKDAIVTFPQARFRLMITKLPGDLGPERVKRADGSMVEVLKIPARLFLLLLAQVSRVRSTLR